MKTVEELRDTLNLLIGEGLAQLPVILAQDGEGNGFNPYSGQFSFGRYDPKYRSFESPEELDDDDEILVRDDNAAIVLWP
jgi:hypothetical protein